MLRKGVKVQVFLSQVWGGGLQGGGLDSVCSPAQVGGPESVAGGEMSYKACDRPEFPGVSACGQYRRPGKGL